MVAKTTPGSCGVYHVTLSCVESSWCKTTSGGVGAGGKKIEDIMSELSLEGFHIR